MPRLASLFGGDIDLINNKVSNIMVAVRYILAYSLAQSRRQACYGMCRLHFCISQYCY